MARRRRQPKLTHAQRVAARRDRNPLYDPTQQLGGNQLYTAAKQITDSQVKPTLSAFDTQSRNATTQGRALSSNAAGYYRDLAHKELSGLAMQNALGSQLQQQIKGVGAQQQQGLNDIGGDDLRFIAADRALRGPGLDGTQPTAVARAYANAGQDAVTSQAAGERAAAAQGNDWSSLMAATGNAVNARGGELQQQLANRLANTQADIGQKRQDFAASKAGLFADTLQKMRQQSYENLVTNKGLDIKTADLQSQIANQNTTARLAAARIRSQERQANARVAATLSGQATTRRGQDLSHQDRVTANAIRAATTGKTAGGKPLTALQRRNARATAAKAWSTVDNTLGLMDPSTARVTVDAKSGKTRAATTAETVAGLRGKKTPEWAIQAALSIRHHGFILPSVLKTIKASNPYIRIPSKYLPGGARSYNGPH